MGRERRRGTYRELGAANAVRYWRSLCRAPSRRPRRAMRRREEGLVDPHEPTLFS
jgi:hypothetical protein